MKIAKIVYVGSESFKNTFFRGQEVIRFFFCHNILVKLQDKSELRSKILSLLNRTNPNRLPFF